MYPGVAVLVCESMTLDVDDGTVSRSLVPSSGSMTLVWGVESGCVGVWRLMVLVFDSLL